MSLFFEGVDPNHQEAWAHAEQQRSDYERKHESNWQSPSALGACARMLIQSLDTHPDIFKELEISQYLDSKYYLSGEFRRDLDHLYRIVAWAEKNHVPRVRLLMM